MLDIKLIKQRYGLSSLNDNLYSAYLFEGEKIAILALKSNRLIILYEQYNFYLNDNYIEIENVEDDIQIKNIRINIGIDTIFPDVNNFDFKNINEKDFIRKIDKLLKLKVFL